ncbi:MAG: hypothetical protein WBA48_03565 [Xanthobacteraceae bacterium]
MARIPTKAQREIAAHLGYDPGSPDAWDFDIVERLDWMRRYVGEEPFLREVLRLKGHPA